MGYFLWLLLICSGITATVISYRIGRSKLTELIIEDEIDDEVAWRLVVGNNIVTLVSAALVLVLILLFLNMTDSDDARMAVRSRNQELAVEQELGKELGEKMLDGIVGTDLKALVIDQVMSPASREIHNARLKGLREAFGDRVYISGIELLDRGDPSLEEQLQALVLLPRSEEFDRIIRKYPQCTIVVSFAGLPLDYESSQLQRQAMRKRVALGIITDSVYTMGLWIEQKEIKVCALPESSARKRRVSGARGGPVEQNYIVITPQNLLDQAKKHPQKFQRSSRSRKTKSSKTES